MSSEKSVEDERTVRWSSDTSSMVVGEYYIYLTCAFDGGSSSSNSGRQSRQLDCLLPRPTVSNGGPLFRTEPLDGR